MRGLCKQLVILAYIVAGIIMLKGVVAGFAIEPTGAPQQAVQYAQLCFTVIAPYCAARVVEKVLLGWWTVPGADPSR